MESLGDPSSGLLKNQNEEANDFHITKLKYLADVDAHGGRGNLEGKKD
jgi:hypothetical protein